MVLLLRRAKRTASVNDISMILSPSDVTEPLCAKIRLTLQRQKEKHDIIMVKSDTDVDTESKREDFNILLPFYSPCIQISITNTGRTVK
jgi:hypothetical protein